MKKIVVLMLFVFVSSVCFAGYPQNDRNPHAGRDQIFIDSFNQAKETQEKLLSLEVGKENVKEFDLAHASKKIVLNKTKLDMGSYDLTFKTKEDGTLVVTVRLHEGEENYPSHFLTFKDEFATMANRKDSSGNWEYLQTYNIKMSLFTSEKVLVSTYTLGHTW